MGEVPENYLNILKDLIRVDLRCEEVYRLMGMEMPELRKPTALELRLEEELRKEFQEEKKKKGRKKEMKECRRRLAQAAAKVAAQMAALTEAQTAALLNQDISIEPEASTSKRGPLVQTKVEDQRKIKIFQKLQMKVRAREQNAGTAAVTSQEENTPATAGENVTDNQEASKEKNIPMMTKEVNKEPVDKPKRKGAKKRLVKPLELMQVEHAHTKVIQDPKEFVAEIEVMNKITTKDNPPEEVKEEPRHQLEHQETSVKKEGEERYGNNSRESSVHSLSPSMSDNEWEEQCTETRDNLAVFSETPLEKMMVPSLWNYNLMGGSSQTLGDAPLSDLKALDLSTAKEELPLDLSKTEVTSKVPMNLMYREMLGMKRKQASLDNNTPEPINLTVASSYKTIQDCKNEKILPNMSSNYSLIGESYAAFREKLKDERPTASFPEEQALQLIKESKQSTLEAQETCSRVPIPDIQDDGHLNLMEKRELINYSQTSDEEDDDVETVNTDEVTDSALSLVLSKMNLSQSVDDDSNEFEGFEDKETTYPRDFDTQLMDDIDNFLVNTARTKDENKVVQEEGIQNIQGISEENKTPEQIELGTSAKGESSVQQQPKLKKRRTCQKNLRGPEEDLEVAESSFDMGPSLLPHKGTQNVYNAVYDEESNLSAGHFQSTMSKKDECNLNLTKNTSDEHNKINGINHKVLKESSTFNFTNVRSDIRSECEHILAHDDFENMEEHLSEDDSGTDDEMSWDEYFGRNNKIKYFRLYQINPMNQSEYIEVCRRIGFCHMGSNVHILLNYGFFHPNQSRNVPSNYIPRCHAFYFNQIGNNMFVPLSLSSNFRLTETHSKFLLVNEPSGPYQQGNNNYHEDNDIPEENLEETNTYVIKQNNQLFEESIESGDMKDEYIQENVPSSHEEVYANGEEMDEEPYAEYEPNEECHEEDESYTDYYEEPPPERTTGNHLHQERNDPSISGISSHEYCYKYGNSATFCDSDITYLTNDFRGVPIHSLGLHNEITSHTSEDGFFKNSPDVNGSQNTSSYFNDSLFSSIPCQAAETQTAALVEHFSQATENSSANTSADFYPTQALQKSPHQICPSSVNSWVEYQNQLGFWGSDPTLSTELDACLEKFTRIFVDTYGKVASYIGTSFELFQRIDKCIKNASVLRNTNPPESNYEAGITKHETAPYYNENVINPESTERTTPVQNEESAGNNAYFQFRSDPKATGSCNNSSNQHSKLGGVTKHASMKYQRRAYTKQSVSKSASNRRTFNAAIKTPLPLLLPLEPNSNAIPSSYRFPNGAIDPIALSIKKASGGIQSVATKSVAEDREKRETVPPIPTEEKCPPKKCDHNWAFTYNSFNPPTFPSFEDILRVPALHDNPFYGRPLENI